MATPRNQPILVTGSPRSGTTWVGQMIARHPAVVYVWEPFNYHNRPYYAPMHCWFQQVTAAHEEQFRTYLRPLLEFRYPWREAVLERHTPRRFVGATLRSAAAWWRRITGCRPLMKDPIALFSAEWLARTYGMDMVVLIRHPAAFVSSLKRLKWRYRFHNFVNQPELLNGLLHPLAAEIVAHHQVEHSPIDDGILLWRVVHHVIRHYQQHHPDWIFLRHEDISQHPLEEFGWIFERIGLQMTSSVRRAIETHSSEDNPPEAGDQVVHQLKRHSKANVWNWQQRLSADEIARIRVQTEDMAPYWYGKADWGDTNVRPLAA
jgi:hypothetical protein